MLRTTLTLCLALVMAVSAFGQEKHQVGEMTLSSKDAKSLFKTPSYSPYAGRKFPTRVYWGDTHLHTNLSLDARAFGVTLARPSCCRSGHCSTLRGISPLRMKALRRITMAAW